MLKSCEPRVVHFCWTTYPFRRNPSVSHSHHSPELAVVALLFLRRPRHETHRRLPPTPSSWSVSLLNLCTAAVIARPPSLQKSDARSATDRGPFPPARRHHATLRGADSFGGRIARSRQEVAVGTTPSHPGGPRTGEGNRSEIADASSKRLLVGAHR